MPQRSRLPAGGIHRRPRSRARWAPRIPALHGKRPQPEAREEKKQPLGGQGGGGERDCPPPPRHLLHKRPHGGWRHPHTPACPAHSPAWPAVSPSWPRSRPASRAHGHTPLISSFVHSSVNLSAASWAPAVRQAQGQGPPRTLGLRPCPLQKPCRWWARQV